MPQSKPEDPGKVVPEPLENGLHLGATEFLRRYEAMPEIKKAELIDGIVYLGSPVRFDQHSEPYTLIQGWLLVYKSETPGTAAGGGPTVRLGPDDVPQPDALLFIRPEYGGQAQLDSKGYVLGPPDLVVEIGASIASTDRRQKRDSYRRAGVREYLLWRTVDRAIDWWVLEEEEYRPLPVDGAGVVRSRVFPGLWLDTSALLTGDSRKILAKLHEGLRSADHAAFVSSLEQARQKKS